MKSILMLIAVALISTTECKSQIDNAKTETVKIFGNCGMCETTIEKAADKNKISKADWSEETKMATITYDSNKTTLNAVLKNIALAGYDNQSFIAPDEAYNKLPGCCKYDREKKQMAVTSTNNIATPMLNNAKQEQDGNINNASQAPNQLKIMFNNYFSLKDELVKTDGNSASAKAKELQTAINGVKMDKLSMDVHNVWMKTLNDLKEDAEFISGTKDISRQRDHFMRLSKNMYDLIKVAKLDETIYYQFCPMANKGKGANWLSKENGIKNPYYGSQMLTCGNVVKTIKQ